MRGPLVGAEVYAVVMAAAGWVCQCTGECGNAHARSGGRCPASNSGRARLIAAPAEPLPDHQAVAADPGELRAWCPTCWQHLHAAATRARAAAAADAQASLF